MGGREGAGRWVMRAAPSTCACQAPCWWRLILGVKWRSYLTIVRPRLPRQWRQMPLPPCPCLHPAAGPVLACKRRGWGLGLKTRWAHTASLPPGEPTHPLGPASPVPRVLRGRTDLWAPCLVLCPPLAPAPLSPDSPPHFPLKRFPGTCQDRRLGSGPTGSGASAPSGGGARGEDLL